MQHSDSSVSPLRVSKSAERVESVDRKERINKYVPVSELGYGSDHYLPFDNVVINHDYLLIKDQSTNAGKTTDQLMIEPVYSQP
jgi:hypothetical protein